MGSERRLLSILMQGAGHDALLAARVLTTRGHQVTLITPDNALPASDRQAHVMTPKATNIFGRLGLSHVLEAAHPVNLWSMFKPNGEQVVTSRFSQNERSFAISEGSFRDALQNGLRTEIQTGIRVTGINETREGIEVDFHHMPTGRFDLAIAADGSHSAQSGLRSLAFPNVRSEDLGSTIFETIIPVEALPDQESLTSPRDYIAPGRAISVVPVRKTHLAVYAIVQEPLQTDLSLAPLARLQKVFSDFNGPIQGILASLTKTNNIQVKRAEMVPPAIRAGDMVAIGEAAYGFPQYPLQMGLQLLAEDVELLAGLLDGLSLNKDDALERYKHMRYYRAMDAQISASVLARKLQYPSGNSSASLIQREQDAFYGQFQSGQPTIRQTTVRDDYPGRVVATLSQLAEEDKRLSFRPSARSNIA